MSDELSALIESKLDGLPEEAKRAPRGVRTEPDKTFDAERQPWEKQPWETDTEFEMFTLYRDLPAPRRTLDEMYRIWTDADPSKRIYSAPARRISAQNRWVERVEAYTLYLDDHLRASLEEARVQIRLKYLDIGQMMREKAVEALKVLAAVVYETDAEGNKHVRSNLSVRQIIELTRAAHDYESFALLMDQWNKPTGTTVNVINVSDKELLRDAKDVLEAYADAGVVIDGANP
jgi:hypothetical protein